MNHEIACDAKTAEWGAAERGPRIRAYFPEKNADRSFYPFVKRFFDVVLSVCAIAVLVPLFLILAIAVRLDSPGPAIFSQIRVGEKGRTFVFYKFRSMYAGAEEKRDCLRRQNQADGPVFKMSNDPRITKIGCFLRKTSLDELPQLVNVLRGEMSIVGPRPPLENEVAEYTPEQMRRLDVRPGLTCYWQVGGRSSLSFEEWMRLDFKYIRERGLRTDLKIILKTVPAVLSGRGAY